AMKGGFDVMFENSFLVRCWEENKCENTACPCYQSENLRCWQVVGTFCGGEVTCHFAHDIGSCTECPVFKTSCQRDEITAIGEGFNNMMLLLKLEARTKEEMRSQLLDKLISAQEEERKRIARELHDQTSQSLTSLILGLKTLETASDSSKVKQGALDLQDLTLHALDEVRRLSIELRPAALDELGLVAALRSYFRESSQRSHINIDFRTQGLKERPPATMETALYRIIQEAVTNVIKHAEAKNISIILEQRDGTILTRIQDDGKGFEVRGIHTSAVWGKGLGLLGMRERAALLGGELTVESGRGEGTTVRVTMPMRVVGG
ncbi:MAG: sensor histidine kinase, partial [Chloroflexi bacterium]|nr:sensor histidine kinase [Chloroflexota bacterium]